MEFLIENFGPIKEFEINLDKDLTLIVGRNNLGKSYAISIIYVVLKSIINNIDEDDYNTFRKIFRNKSFLAADDSNDKLIKLIVNDLKKNTKQVNCTDVFKKYCLKNIDRIITNDINESLIATFGDLRAFESSDVKPKITLKDPFFSYSFEISANTIQNTSFEFATKVYFKSSKRNIKPKTDQDTLTFYINTKKLQEDENSWMDSLKETLHIFSYGLIHGFLKNIVNTIGAIHYLPASRSGLYQSMSAFGQIIAELAKKRTFTSKKIELPAISEPLVDYFLKLTEIKNSKIDLENSLCKIASEMELNILNGSVDFDINTKKIYYTKNNKKLKLDLSQTSSMVSEIAPIISYMKHILPHSLKKGSNSKQLIFIEEPEAHLHPEIQVKLIENFTKMVNESNVKIIITSHSNFILNKINNLLIAEDIPLQKTQAFLFTGTDEGSVGLPLNIDQFGIDDENFVDIASEIYEEKMELIEKVISNKEKSDVSI